MKRIQFIAAASCLALLTAAGAAPPAQAQSHSPEQNVVDNDEEDEGALDKDWAIGLYGTGWAGAYSAGGIGGKLRWEPLDLLGVEVFSEHNIVDHPTQFRHDHTIGFSLYVPLTIAGPFRGRILAGACANFSVIEGDALSPGADDVQFGVHAGGGFEVGIGATVSLFIDGMYNGWIGHQRDVGGWTGAVSEEIEWSHFAQFNGGLSIHL